MGTWQQVFQSGSLHLVEEAAVAGRLARLVQQAADQEEDLCCWTSFLFVLSLRNPSQAGAHDVTAASGDSLVADLAASRAGCAGCAAAPHPQNCSFAVLKANLIGRPCRGSDQITDAVTTAKSLPVRLVRMDVDDARSSSCERSAFDACKHRVRLREMRVIACKHHWSWDHTVKRTLVFCANIVHPKTQLKLASTEKLGTLWLICRKQKSCIKQPKVFEDPSPQKSLGGCSQCLS